MTTAKSGYIGDGTGQRPCDFTLQLKLRLRAYYPQSSAIACPYFGHPADVFLEEVLAAARPSIIDLMWLKMDITKQELRTEQADLIKHLKITRDGLRTMSTPLSVLLDIKADPLGAADALDTLICQMEAATPRIDALQKKQRPDEARHDIAVKMAINVARELNKHGIKVSATAGTYDRMVDITAAYSGPDQVTYTSKAVEILKAIGDDIGLDLNQEAWRDIISEAKKIAPNIW